MADVSDKELALAKVYAESVFALAEEKGAGDSLLEELTDLVAYLDKDPDLDRFLSSPMVDAEVRRAMIEKAFRGRASDLLVDTLQVLNRKERLPILRALAESYRIAHEERRGCVDVHVRTAAPLPDWLRARLTAAAERLAGRRPELIEEVDDSVIGGVVVQIGDRKIDASVATRLRHLAEALHERASHEIHSGRAYVEETPG